MTQGQIEAYIKIFNGEIQKLELRIENIMRQQEHATSEEVNKLEFVIEGIMREQQSLERAIYCMTKGCLKCRQLEECKELQETCVDEY